MRLSRIELENFKGVGKRQRIDLKPITLLFGANSAGKSTILQALHYVREILERQNADPDQTIAGGLINLGGFKNLIHNHDLSKSINIKLVIDLSDDQGSEFLPLNSGQSLKNEQFQKLPVRYVVGENTDLKEYVVVQSVGATMTVAWSKRRSAPYVSHLMIEMDGEDIASIDSPADKGRAQLKKFNFSHPLFYRQVDQDDDDFDVISGSEIESVNGVKGDPFTTPLGEEIWELSRELAHGSSSSNDTEFRINVETELGALPSLDRLLKCGLRDPNITKAELEENTPRVLGLSSLLDELMLGPLRIIRHYLSDMTYIGPLREIPERNFRAQTSPDEGRWALGLAAWDHLYSDTEGNLLPRVNKWLNSSDRLGTDYEISRSEFIEVPTTSRFNQLFRRGVDEDDLGDLQEEYDKLGSRTEIVLRDTVRGIDVAPSDVGVGISQLVPVVVGCLRTKAGILSVEQPELHIHPAIQVGVGDLFIEAAMPSESSFGSSKILLVETHSEHIMLRLLRRVRETNGESLPPGALPLKPDNLSVIYVENTKDIVLFRPIRVDSDGDFRDRWPKGFFRERSGELF